MKKLRVAEDGGTEELNSLSFNSDEVFLIVDEDGKNVYIWIGCNASVRKRFAAARAAGELKRKDLAYSNVTIDEEYEPTGWRSKILTV